MEQITVNQLGGLKRTNQQRVHPHQAESVKDIPPHNQQHLPLSPEKQQHAHILINMPDQIKFTPEEPAKETENRYCGQKLNKMQCVFLIMSIFLFTAGTITLGLVLGRNWVNNSVTASTTPKQTTYFVTLSGNHISTANLIIEQAFLLKEPTHVSLLITKIEPPISRNLQEYEAGAVAALNPPAFVTLTNGSITVKSCNSQDLMLVVDVAAFEQELQESGRLFEKEESKQQLFRQIRQQIARVASVDPEQVFITEEIHLNIVINEQNELAAEENQAPATNASTTDAQPAETETVPALNEQDKTTKIKEFAIKAAARIAKVYTTAADQLKRYEKTIEESTSTQFKTTNNLLVSQEVEKKLDQNHILITRQYESALHRTPRTIHNSIIIPKHEFEGIKHCHEHPRGKFCLKTFVNRVDNPFVLSDSSRERAQHHKEYTIYKITIHDKEQSKHSKPQAQHNHPLRDESNAGGSSKQNGGSTVVN